MQWDVFIFFPEGNWRWEYWAQGCGRVQREVKFSLNIDLKKKSPYIWIWASAVFLCIDFDKFLSSSFWYILMFIMSNPGVEPQACLGVNTTATTPYPSMCFCAILFESNTCFLGDYDKFLAFQCFLLFRFIDCLGESYNDIKIHRIGLQRYVLMITMQNLYFRKAKFRLY